MCTKQKHPTKDSAFAAWRRTGSNAAMDVYWCKPCKSFHLGHSNKPHRRTARINQLLDAVLHKN